MQLLTIVLCCKGNGSVTCDFRLHVMNVAHQEIDKNFRQIQVPTFGYAKLFKHRIRKV
jgi:hypothetical protein